MNKVIATFCAAAVFALAGCGDSNTNKTTTIKRETKIDGDGNERTKVETKTEETSVRTTDPVVNHNTEVVREKTVEVKGDPIIKLGPLEVHK